MFTGADYSYYGNKLDQSYAFMHDILLLCFSEIGIVYICECKSKGVLVLRTISEARRYGIVQMASNGKSSVMGFSDR